MIFFLVAFLALTAFKQCYPLFRPQATISCSETYHPSSSCLHHDYNHDETYDSFSNNDVAGSILHLYYIAAGHKTQVTGSMTHNPGRMTHNLGRMTHNPGRMTHNPGCMTHSCMTCIPGCMTQPKLSIQGISHLLPHCHSIRVSNKQHYRVFTCYGMINRLSCQCHHCHLIVFNPMHYNLSEEIETHLFASNQQSFSLTISYYVPPYKVHFISHSVQKQHKYPKSSSSPLVLATNRCLYHLLNGTFNQVDVVNCLINRLLLMLQQYITRHNDFKHRWLTLLLTGLLRLQHISLWFLIVIVMFLKIRDVTQKLSWFQKMIYTMNLAINVIVVMSLLYHTSLLDQNTPSTTGFIGGGSSARATYEFLKPYVLSTKIQLKNPDEFNYIYGGHRSLNNAMQEMQTSGEAMLVCNIPLALVANILTSTQADKVAKEHKLYALSRKSLAEKRAAVETHICTKSCNQCVTMFKPVKKNQKSVLRQHSTKGKEVKTHPKVGRKSMGKLSRVTRNHKYYVRENAKFPPSPPSKRLMHKIISGFCNDTHPSKFEESGCAACGQLVVMTKLMKLTDVKCSLDPLVRKGVTRLPQSSLDDPIREIDGPIVDVNCKHICHECVGFLEKKVMPPMALANGLWVGNVPKELSELSELTFVERLLVSRVRSNRCIIHVLKGGWKMRANAIPTPLPKLCNILPPPVEELDEVIRVFQSYPTRPQLEPQLEPQLRLLRASTSNSQLPD